MGRRKTSGHTTSSAVEEQDDDKSTLAARVYQQLRDDIVLGVLRPGQKLKLDSLKGRYDLGMTPLREALYRLSSSALVTVEERRGFTVASVSPAHLAEVIELREDAEVMLLRNAFKHSTLQWESRIVAAFHQLQRTAGNKPNVGPPSSAWEAAHQNFHMALLSAAKLPMLSSFHAVLWDHAARYRNLAQAVDVRLDVFEGHEQLMKAVIERDEGLACALLRRHISLATAGLMQRLFPDQ